MSLPLSNVLIYRDEQGWHYTLYFTSGATLNAPIASMRPHLAGLRSLTGEIRRDLSLLHRLIPTEGWLRIEGENGWVLKDPRGNGAVLAEPAPRRRQSDREGAPKVPPAPPAAPSLATLTVRH